ncbi:TVP38/TMEM64 family protein [bacterium]|jgi:uncharacterized membrane protein YdjX (TVP38/TMEM64 family)|nr:TVP38/TMEM64 family protein [bacterium]MBT5015761.1 TVP38/TMEM64 family protein [bacterium]
MENKTIKRLVILGVLAAIIFVFFIFDLGRFFSLEVLKLHREWLLEYVHAHYIVSVLTFIASYIVFAGTALPGSPILSLAGGFLFGTILGTLYIVIGASIGAAIAFLIVRYIFGSILQKRYKERLKRLNNNIDRNGVSYVLILRFIAIVPFFLVNILAGLTTISLRTFVWTTAVGITPGAFVFAYAGKQLGSINKVSDVFSWTVILAFVLLAVLALIPSIFRVLRKNNQ